MNIKKPVQKIILTAFCFFSFALSAGEERLAAGLIADSYVKVLNEIERKIRSFAAADAVGIAQKIHDGSQLSKGEVLFILEAKLLWTKLLNKEGRFLDLKELSRNPDFSVLEKIRTLSSIQHSQVDYELHAFLFNLHKKHFAKIDQKRRKVIVQGAGPVGLIAGIKLYIEGMDVTIVEKRDGDYTRGQIVSLDPLWVSELRWLLGSEFDRLIESGYAVLGDDDVLQITINKLERALKERILDMIDTHSGMEGLPGLQLRYKTELVKVKKPKSPGVKFRVKVKDGKNFSEEDLEFDSVVFAGGGADRVRDTYLDFAAPCTKPVEYAVLVWKKNNRSGAERKGKNYELGMDTRKYKSQIAETYKQLSRNLMERSRIREKRKEHLLAILSQVHWESQVDFREFENRHHLYIGVELPQALAHFGFALKKYIEGSSNEKEKEDLLDFKRVHDQATFAIISKIWEVNGDGFSLDEKNSSIFTLVQRAVERPAYFMRSSDSKAAFFAVGDAMISPHFFSGTGLTSGRDSVNNLVKGIKKMSKGRANVSEENAVGRVVLHQKRVISYALEKGKQYAPSVLPLEVTEARLAKIKTLLLKDLEKNPDTLAQQASYKLEKNGNLAFNLHFKDEKGQKKVVPFQISATGDLYQESREYNYWQFFISMGVKPRALAN